MCIASFSGGFSLTKILIDKIARWKLFSVLKSDKSHKINIFHYDTDLGDNLLLYKEK